MTSNQLMTAGAVALAGFALYYTFRTPGGNVSAQPGQQQRDLGLSAWLGDVSGSYTRMGTADYWKHVPNTAFAVLPGTFGI